MVGLEPDLEVAHRELHRELDTRHLKVARREPETTQNTWWSSWREQFPVSRRPGTASSFQVEGRGPFTDLDEPFGSAHAGLFRTVDGGLGP